MAVRFDAGTDQYGYSGTVPDPSAGWTLVFWAYLSVDRDATSTMFRASASGSSSAIISTGTDGTILVYLTGGGTIVSGHVMTVGQWSRAAVTCTGTSGVLYGATATGATDVASGTVSGAASPDTIGVGGRGGGDTGEWFNGRIQAMKLYSAVLTQAEIESEWQQITPVRVANLHAWWPLLDSSDRTDYSGNARSLTAGSTATATEDGPPIPWGPPLPQLILPTTQTAVVIDQATETDSAGAITPIQVIAISQATELDEAGAITPVQRVLIDQAAELDAAGVITPLQIVVIDQATETDSAGAITPIQVIGQAAELDSAGAIDPVQSVLIAQATEADSAGIIAPPTVPVTAWPPRAGSITVTGVATATVTIT